MFIVNKVLGAMRERGPLCPTPLPMRYLCNHGVRGRLATLAGVLRRMAASHKKDKLHS